MTEPKKRPVGRPRLGKVKVIISLMPEALALLDRFAEKSGVSRSDCVNKLIIQLLK